MGIIETEHTANYVSEVCVEEGCFLAKAVKKVVFYTSVLLVQDTCVYIRMYKKNNLFSLMKNSKEEDELI